MCTLAGSPPKVHRRTGVDFCKTYAETWPHEYIVQERVDADLVAQLAHHIDSYGYTEYFYQKPVIYFEHDGYAYWHMGIIINRCVVADTFLRRKQDGRLPDTKEHV